MTEVCPRCGSVLSLLEGSPAPFCAACGLPQLRVSADAAATFAETVQPGAVGVQQGGAVSAGLVDWHRALPLAFAAAALSATVAFLVPGSVALGSAMGLCPALAPLAGLLAVHLYGRGHGSFGARAGARIGAVTGLLLAFLAAASTAIAGFVLRYSRHSRELETTLVQNSALATAQFRSSGVASPRVLGLLASPEFRAATWISGHLFLAAVVLALAAAFGAFAGLLRQLRRRRMQP